MIIRHFILTFFIGLIIHNPSKIICMEKERIAPVGDVCSQKNKQMSYQNFLEGIQKGNLADVKHALARNILGVHQQLVHEVCPLDTAVRYSIINNKLSMGLIIEMLLQSEVIQRNIKSSIPLQTAIKNCFNGTSALDANLTILRTLLEYGYSVFLNSDEIKFLVQQQEDIISKKAEIKYLPITIKNVLDNYQDYIALNEAVSKQPRKEFLMKAIELNYKMLVKKLLVFGIIITREDFNSSYGQWKNLTEVSLLIKEFLSPVHKIGGISSKGILTINNRENEDNAVSIPIEIGYLIGRFLIQIF